ncbi:endonuclease/exonuclease/phosphatase family protein [Algoriphagus zhangzhouensis]|uniref:Exonuclease III n=1 Tax=Algoriphagus zhangzhouensis TaxID=1073327 RepID=A0A1M7ZBJ9_9BACT|nr:endonuclease/exonuclease/phosphatase family protein [Algoriphagus zhangzhouensis]TDY46842.1 exodeoxyribonuclease-3 [Algoriphagus zhangzhouensis]SHO62199.1 Exonuclease III [Algoriphagus zhangzhouensis]
MKIKFLFLILFTIGLSHFLFAQTNESSLKVMTYNIWNGFDWGKDTLRQKNLINWVKEQNPDVLALEELCGYDEEKLRKDAAQWGHPYVQILKERGYPTALTSKEPIQLIEKNVDNFWHGLLHVKTFGLDFFVVHLSPSDSDIRLREARQIKSRIKELQSDSFIVLGDFNSHSPLDAYWLEKKGDLRAKNQKKEGDKYDNLRLGQFDYAPISEFFSIPAVDVSLNKIDLEKSFTFPSPVLIGLYDQTAETIIQYRVRIDYILTSPELAQKCVKVEIFNHGIPDTLSDHFPVMAEFKVERD